MHPEQNYTATQDRPDLLDFQLLKLDK